MRAFVSAIGGMVGGIALLVACPGGSSDVTDSSVFDAITMDAGIVDSVTVADSSPFDAMSVADALAGDGGTAAGFWMQTGSDLFYTDGNVGIGTTGPTQKLHVVENAADWVAFFDNDHADGFGVLINTADSDTNDAFAIDTGVAGARQFVVRNDGNVGIGTTAPNTALSLGGTDPVIAMDTVDGSDTKRLQLAGGGASGQRA